MIYLLEVYLLKPGARRRSQPRQKTISTAKKNEKTFFQKSWIPSYGGPSVLCFLYPSGDISIRIGEIIMGACLSSDKGHLQVDDSVRFFSFHCFFTI